MQAVAPRTIVLNGRGFEYPKGKTPRFGWRFYLNPTIEMTKTPITANPML